MTEPTSLIDVVGARVAERPGEAVYTFVDENGAEAASVTWRELDRRARAVGARLQEARAGGQRAVLVYPPGIDFISAFLGCLYGGTVGVPVHPPRPGKPDPRLAAIVADARPRVVLTTTRMREQVEAWAARMGAGAVRVVATDDLAEGEGEGWRPVRPAPGSLAFLQYTSGSTATPKGVMVTHDNLLHNEEAIRRAYGQSESSVIVSWLPLYHDMGLIGGVLQPLYAGGRCVLMSPLTFLQTPFRWLEAISRYRGTTSGGPNFGYELCIRKVGEAERAGLDLSSWSVAFNGAEPVRAGTLRRFAEAFAPAGFDAGAFRPSYGLAEATLLVAVHRPGRPATATVSAAGLEHGDASAVEEGSAEAARTLVSCGVPEAEHGVAIVDPETRLPLAPGRVGEIWVSGPSVAAGYWNRPDATEEVFRARLADGGGASAFLRTGDLGFVRDGDLFVAGRLKDLIIVRGRNHHPHDIELTAEKAHASVRPGSAAAFAVELDGEERLVVACEVERHLRDDPRAVAEAVRRAVSDEHQLAPHDVVLLRAGSVPKTSSGKIRRHACREAYAAGSWEEVAATRPAAPAAAPPPAREDRSGILALLGDMDGDARLAVVTSLCRREVARVARVDTSAIDPGESLTRLGVESLGAVELMHTLERELGISVPLGEILRGPSLSELARLIVRELDAPAAERPLSPPRGPLAAEYPLSFGQRALYFVQRLAPGSGAYNVAAAARVRSELDVPALRRACTGLLSRHTTLRSTFHDTPDGPVQRAGEAADIEFRVEDAAGWDEGELAARMAAEADRPFDLERGPLFRVLLFRDAEGGYRLLLVVHHIATDFWTMRVLLGELAALYGAERGGEPARLAPLPLGFADHVAAERERLDGPEGERLWAFWSEQLRDAPTELELATDRPRGRVQGFRGALEHLRLPAELSEAVRRLARARGVTAHAVLLAAYQVLLHRYSGQRDLLVGVPAAGRTGPEWAGVAGYFVNPLPIRARFTGDPRFGDVVAQAQAATVAALEHQAYPFPLLTQRIQPERDPARPPLVQALFAWHAPDGSPDASLGAFALGEAGGVARLGGLVLESMRLERGSSSFDLSLQMSEADGCLLASLQYDTDLFDRATAAGLLRHLAQLLAEATSSPDRRIGEIGILSGAERAELEGWNATEAEYADVCLHELFEAQAARTPDAPALVWGGEMWSYRRMDARANAVAAELRARGVGPEVRVGVCARRTPALVAGLLGVMKAGGAYVPVDPAYPRERQAYMLEDSGAAVLLGDEAAEECAEGRPVVPLDAGERAEPLPPAAVPGNLAYVIYTSGSTGRPKGVAIEHRSAVAFAHWAHGVFGPEELDGVLAATSVCFDLSVFELFVTMAWGGCVVLADNVLELPRLAAAERVRLVNTVPSGMAELVRAGGVPASVRTVNLAGEPLPGTLVEEVYARTGVRRVLNLYGPSEDTTYSTGAEIARGERMPPIGVPVANTRAHVVDGAGELAPVGVPGELYLGGAGLARGYWNRPALTAERFVPDPFGPAGARLYRTGDQVRRRRTGELEYLGRRDHQVKVRGFRIELGEIDAVLRAHPGVLESVVVVREDVPGDRRLVAYVAAKPEAPTDEAALRAHLEERLPAYMVPSAFLWMERLPLTATGKIDRAALPVPNEARSGAYVAPRTPTEEMLAGIYADVLGVERVGARDSFFELGGHSLLATRVVSRVRDLLGAELPLTALFESPTVERLAAALERARAPGLPAVVPVPRGGGVPLSFAQERLWFLDRLQPGGSVYNLPAALRLRGPLDESALERTLAELVRRHESLRTTFGSRGGAPVQVIHPPRERVLEVEDLTTLAASEREDEAGRRARDEAQRSFDLAAGPLFRARLLRLSDAEHVLLLVVHHVVFDGWSTGVLLRELSAVYAAFSQGLPSPLPEPRLQYADYAAWQAEHLAGGALEEQLAYWRERLAGAPALLELPTDRPRPALPSHLGAVESLRVPAELAAQLNALGRREGATPFMVLLAAFQLLLAKYSGQEDVVVGSPIAGRTRAELEGLVGFFVNTLALRTDLSGDLSFRELLARVREATLGAYAHQDLPFERLVQDVAPERSLGHAPLFQVMLTLQNTPREEPSLEGVEVEWLALEDTAAKFDLALFANESDAGLDLSLQYATELLDASTARRMLEHLQALLEEAAAHPDGRLSELEMLGAEERARLVGGWSPATHPHACIHTLFERQAAATPEHTALVHGDERVDYAGLDTRANRLAHHLAGLGVGPEVRVGVLMERTPEMVAALLAVLKAGGAYVPLDPGNPAERLGYMIQDARVSLVLTTTALAERLPESSAGVVHLDALDLAAQPADAPESGVRPENLSHVIYTSGSTGRPKGVMIRHSSASVLLHWMRETVTDAERRSALFSTSISFDVSVAELFGTLCWGGTAVLVENALELARVAEPVAYASMVPTAAAELLRTGGIPASVRTLNLAGEALSSDLAQGLYGLGTVEKVANVYGPTEDTTYSTYSLVAKGATEVRIGRPLPGTRAYVLDAHLRPVPVGVPGELYLAGEGVARGYAEQPALTADRFVPDPFGPAGARMYRTQDRVRWRADGELEYFGRTDHQVKVRGFRVELGEIGAVLGEHAAVAEAVVVARAHGGDQRLVAYVVPLPGAPADAAELRAHLERRLPAYMVPAAFVALERMPLTGTGKIDRNALPDPEYGAGEALTPPRTPVEQVLAEQWRQVLQVERVGRESNFFDLGGHSLLATRVVSRLREVFGVELPVRALFEAPTLAALAERIEAARGTDRPVPPPIVARPHDGEAPLSFAQERLWLVEQMHPGTAANNIARPLALTGPLDVRALEDALSEVVRRHETLRTTFASEGGWPVQKIAPTGRAALHVVDLEGVAGEHAARLIASESVRPMDLCTGPLFRATLLRNGPEDHTLLLTMHHIVSDGWSLGVLVGEVAELYRAFSAGEPSPLAPLAVQYSDFCRWQREWLRGDVLEAELGYWLERLGGPQPLLEMPSDRPRGAVRGSRGAIRHQRLPARLVEEIERLALGSGASPFMALLAGWVSLLNRYTGQDDVRVGTFIANRTRAEVEPLFGFFLNNLVLRTQVGPGDTFRALLRQVRDVTLDAYAHQEVPFEKVLEAVNPERTLSHTPLFQVMFVLQNAPLPPVRLRDLTVRVLPVQTTGQNFDMTLWVEEEDGLRLSLQYDTDLFDGTTIERLLAHLAALLEAAVADPDAPLGRLPLLGAGERHALLVEINDTGPVPAADRPGVHRLVEARAQAAPDVVAVRRGGTVLTYGELNRAANRLAHHLRALGAGPEARVALLAERSPAMIAALLGILKSGAAYVPLDPRAPADRLAHILRDSGAALLVADEPLVGGLGAHVPAVVALDGAWAREDGAPEHDPAPLGGGHGAAYVIYTSGSTGRPKGVLVEHRSLLAYTETAIAQYGVRPADRLLQFASVSFDASIEEIFPALAAGATLVLRDDAMLGSPSLFWRACAREGVTVVNLPTAYWHDLAGALGDGPSPVPACVRLLIIGGERALGERVARWQRVVGPAVRLVNTYGPTEATVVATLRDLTEWRAEREVPIGRPVRGARAYVLDAAGQPVPAGVPGELCLGGAGVARGYLDRPGLTAERFVPDPFAAEPGARLYRTGDLARLLPGGELEFVGRGDGQVKIRGYRVELQEIEARLAEHPAVSAAAVVLRKSAEGEPYLAAFVASSEPPSTAQVRGYLAESLPEYMVPSLVVGMDALPMTAGGKVDTRALPATDRPREEGSGEYVAPRTPAEEILASIWAQVLGVERVGVNDSFFELGGYSLLATQVIARIREAFGVELPLVKVFQARTLADLAVSVTDAGQTPLPEVERVPRDGPLPLSFAQERIWFLTQLAPELSAYHVPRALRIRGPLIPDAIEQSYAALVRRHEVLRTTFPAVAGRPVQVVHPPMPVDVPRVDLSGLPHELREAEVLRQILEVGQRRFDLANGPLIRVVLLRLGPDEHVVVQAEHHLVHDGWAEGVLMRDLLGSFAAFVEGRPAELPELPIQFADYAAWQRKWVDGEVLEEQLGYWKEQLAGAPPVLELPTDRARPPVQRFQGGEELLRISAPTVAALQEMGRREGVTLFMAALASFNALLHRYSGQDDIVVGTVLANRRWQEAEGLLGMILNTLPLRTTMRGDPTVRELLAEVRQTCLGAYAHQDAPFEMIVDAVRPPRNLSYPAIFQVMFAFHDARMPALEAPGFEMSGIDAHNRSSKFDMLVIVQADPAPEGADLTLTAAIEYNTDLFDAPTIQRFTRHFENVLRILPSCVDLRLSQLPLMDEDEQGELAEWNATEAEYADVCLHELFEAQAARTPDAPALVWGGETWSYRRMDARANAVAAELRVRGVGPEVRVGVCARRTPALVAGLLGVMKAGGAYVPVDPAYPRERQAYMLEDSGAAVLLGDEAAEECAEGRPVVPLDAGERAEPLPSAAVPGNLAYVIYTSGSTGRPKGVAIEHRSAVAFAHWARGVFGPEDLEGVLASTSVCFDLSVFELFVTMAWGGCVVLADNVLELPRLAAAERVRLVNTVPSGMAELVRTGGVPATVRTVNLAGEPLPGTLVDEVYARTDVRRVLNLYGPSEDTTYSTGAEIARGERMPPIGVPVANTRAHVVDGAGGLTPVGVPGELYLGGAGLARGYWNRPALTAERFVPDPFGPAGARLYRTGDQVRRRRTGELEYLGRRDHQVKVRGFRIELGEIDAVLRAHPAVLESVVVVREDVPGDRRLVAYVAAKPDVPADEAEVRAHLEERLPAYMVPSAFVWLERLPLTATGKIDRNALPDPEWGHASAEALTPPGTAVEQALAELWSEILRVERVGRESNFFELGGHSLLVTRVASRLPELFGIELSLRTLFERPTLAGLAERIEAAAGTERLATAIAARPHGTDAPLSFAQERLWFLDHLQPGGSAYNLTAALRLRGPLDEGALERSLAELVRRHESLRTTFASDGAAPVQVIHPPREGVLELEDLSTLAADEREGEAARRARDEAQRPFDLAAGPLFRARLLRLSEADHVLLLVVHHVVFDGWSTGVLLRELSAIYGAFSQGLPSPLPEPRLQYADYAAWQGEHLAGGALEEQLAYWRERLAGAPALLELPTDRPRPALPSHRGAVEGLQLPAELAERLGALGRKEGATPFMVLLAAFQLLLAKYSGQEDVVVGSPIAGRTRAELEGLVGFFVNTLALRTDLSGDPTFRELLGRVREVTLGAYAHQDLPFERLVQDVAPERSLGHAPLFQVMFALQNTAGEELRLEGVEVEWFAVENTAAKFDLALYASESAAGLDLSLQYATELLEAATARRMLQHLRALLDAAAAHPDGRLSELDLLGEEEHALVVDWGTTPSAHPHACIHTLFERQAAATPQRTALVHGSERVDYAGLDARANRLAHHLRGAGVGPEVRVGVLMERTPEMVVALLAVLKAGGAYVPLDPANPAERLGYMIEDARVSLVLTTTALADRLPESAAQAVLLDALDLAEHSAEAPESGVQPENLSHVIFTSGSTGRPKGVMIRHSGASVLLHWMRETVSDAERRSALFSTSISFDVSVAELFGTLCWGGTAVLVENALELASVTEPVVYASMVPTAAAELLRTGGIPTSVRTLNLAGEALSSDLAQGLYAAGVEKVANVYGPTEDTTYSTYSLIPRGGTEVRIGRPLPGGRTYVLDAHLRPVPVGVPGELYLAGEGVARGYAEQPALTAERFVPDPFGPAGARMYRTQDRVRWRADGELEYFGRTDHQVKVRGFRVELGEIDAVLRAHPSIAEAVVVTRPHAGDLRLVAYVAASPEAPADEAALRTHLKERLPAYMVPSAFVWLEHLPLTATGKIDRTALPAPQAPAVDTEGDDALPQWELAGTIAGIWAEVLGLEKVGLRSNFFDLGGHSLLALRAQRRLSEALGREVPVVAIFRHPTVQSLAEMLRGELQPAQPVREGPVGTPDIAIVGWSGRFPGAASVDALWGNLCAGMESVSFFTDAELEAAGVEPALISDPRYVKARGVLEDVAGFDAAFFDVGAREAEITDPQHRLFLECAWEALEDAGYDPQRYPGAVGVFAGSGVNSYWLNVYSDEEVVASTGHYAIRLGNEKDFLPTRVSYKLGLRGPSINVQTACSTSLVAVHLACQSLVRGECDMALAGAAAVSAQQSQGYLYQEGGIHSPDGRCRAFDADAGGTVSGNGVGVVLLKPLGTAIADRDHIYAVIKGSAINNDGAVKAGYTAPSVDGQAQVIAAAHQAAGVTADEIGYVEAHGTGTPLGDPIEFAALAQVFGMSREQPCALGSIKTNIGHLDAAAGVAGLIKAAAAVRHGVLPPTLHFQRMNPHIPACTALAVNGALREWTKGTHPRRAGVSSFGIGGTNAHVVVEEPPQTPAPAARARTAQLLVLSARTPSALQAAAANLGRHLRGHDDDLADVAFTLQAGRRAFTHRRVVVCETRHDAAEALETGRGVFDGEAAESAPVAFLFPGQGTQQVEMGLELYRSEPGFRARFDECAALFRRELGVDLREVLYPEPGRRGEAEARLEPTSVTQAALFTVEVALAGLWMEWGVRPDAMIGHSLGEYTAAHLAGVFSLEDAVRLIARRGLLMDGLADTGAMLAVSLPEAELGDLDAAGVSLAAVNGRRQCVISGAAVAVEAFQRGLEARGVASKRLKTARPFHSAAVDEILAEFADEVRRIELHPPLIPFVSNVTGTWIRAGEATDPAYWVRHLRGTVRFDDGLGTLLQEPRTLLEVGPGRTLAALAIAHPERPRAVPVVSSLASAAGEGGETRAMLEALGRLWVEGVAPDWAAHHRHEPASRVSLPTYPFERQRYWIDAGAQPQPQAARPALHKAGDVGQWLYVPQWKPSPLPAAAECAPEEPGRWLLFVDESRAGGPLAEALARDGDEVATVAIGERYAAGPDGYVIDPRRPEDYGRMVDDLAARGALPHRVVHLWNVVALGDGEADARERGFDSLLHLTRALAAAGVEEAIRVDVVTTELQSVDGTEPLCPAKATVLGVCRVVPQERRNLSFRSIDLVLPSDAAGDEREVAGLLRELRGESADRVVAYRRGVRWTEAYTRVHAPYAAPVPVLRQKGVYLIVGGLGRIGLAVAGWLAREAGARLVLTSRTGVAGEEAVRALEAAGAEVLVFQGEAGSEWQMRNVVELTLERFGALHGVIHSAGVVGERAQRAVEETGPEEVAEQFAAKVDGVRALERVIGEMPLDFCLLFSSLSSVLGGLGYTAYSAANQHLDAFARARSRDGGFPWTSIGWDGWRFEQTEPGSPPGAAEVGMTPEEGVEALARALAFVGVPQIVVSTADLDARIAQWVTAPGPAPDRAKGRAHERPRLSTEFQAPRTADERAIAEVWAQLLGIDRIGLDDSFFELGGNSLVATQVTGRLRQTMHVEVPLRAFLQTPTVAGLARAIEAQRAAAVPLEPELPVDDTPSFEDELAEVSRLSDEQVSALIQGALPSATTEGE